MTAKNVKITYWVLTLLFLVPTAGSGFPELFLGGPSYAVENLIKLGYPVYLLRILGFSKIVGAIFILTDRYPRLKEWAYAGFTIDFLGATASHILAGDAATAPAPFAMFLIMLGSYFAWHRSLALDKSSAGT